MVRARAANAPAAAAGSGRREANRARFSGPSEVTVYPGPGFEMTRVASDGAARAAAVAPTAMPAGRSRPHRVRAPPTSTRAAARAPARSHATKYLASGWWQMMASVVCSGFSWNPSLTVTPMRSPPSSSTTLALSARSGQAG